ncbi:MAG TPA: hypothetical protein VE439_07825, partial [Anaerolineae bacterium]|nr:hypothetical protein [Anaerolineae bacterium]
FIALAYFFPPGLLNAPVEGVEVTKPPWPFWAFVPLEELFGVSGILIGSIAILIGLILVPIIGSFIRQERTRFMVVNILLAIGVVTWLVLTIIGYLSPVEKHFG